MTDVLEDLPEDAEAAVAAGPDDGARADDGARPEHNARPAPAPPSVWPAFVLFGVVVLWIVCVGVGLILGLAIYEAGSGVLGRPKELVAVVETVSEGPAALVLGFAVTLPAFLAVPFLFLRKKGESWAQRLRWIRTSAASIVLVTVAGLCLSQVGSFLMTATGRRDESTLRIMTEEVQSSSTGTYLLLLVLFPLTAVGEELFFRGMIQGRLVQRWRPWPAILVTSALFGLLHFDFLHSPFAFLLGVFMGWSVERFQSIVPAVVLHVVNNVIATLSARWPSDAESASGANGGWVAVVVPLVIGTIALVLLARSRPAPQSSAGVTPASSSPDAVPDVAAEA